VVLDVYRMLTHENARVTQQFRGSPGRSDELLNGADGGYFSRPTPSRTRSLHARPRFLSALEALDQELATAGIRADVFVVCGAAMAVAYDARRSTDDVDAAFAPVDAVRRAAQRVADRLGLPQAWLNDGAKAFMPGDDPDRMIVFERVNLQVAAASPRYLLAMKLLAARAERDQDDIRLLYELCGFSTAGEGLAVVEEAYPGYLIPPRTRFMLEEMFPGTERMRQ
jgi:Nucleotidyltransferase of unknown function (DUF6036)